MKAKLLLRIAAAFMLLHTLGHTMGALTWNQAPTPALKLVIDAMLNNHFHFMGRMVTIGDFYAGYGYSMIGVLLLLSILLWMLSTAPNKGMILSIGLFLVFLAVIEFIYFFPFAAAISLLGGVSALLAYRKL